MYTLRKLAVYFLISLLSGCAHFASAPEGVPVALYERTGEAFLMITREDGEGGNTTWGQGSGVAVEDGGRHFIYTARHVLFDKKNNDALPNKLYATTLQGESNTIDFKWGLAPIVPAEIGKYAKWDFDKFFL